MGSAMDIRDPETGVPQVRIAGPDDSDAAWLPLPGALRGGMATVAGHRGPVGFELQITFLHTSDADTASLADLNARAENLARQAAADWSGWLERQLNG
jgi:hypothetical protein